MNCKKKEKRKRKSKISNDDDDDDDEESHKDMPKWKGKEITKVEWMEKENKWRRRRWKNGI